MTQWQDGTVSITVVIYDAFRTAQKSDGAGDKPGVEQDVMQHPPS
jgi:hypothetical protein